MARRTSSSRSRKTQEKHWLPVGVKVFFARRVVDFCAFFILALALVSALALGSYTPGDPSLNTSSAINEIHNWVGVYGAYFADIFIQTLGLAALVLPVVLVVWGWHIFKRVTMPRMSLRFVAFLSAFLVWSFTLYFIDFGNFWYMDNTSSAGGSFGVLTGSKTLPIIEQSVGRFSSWFLIFVGLIAAMALTSYAVFVTFGDWYRGARRVTLYIALAVLKVIVAIGAGLKTLKQGITRYNDDDYLEHDPLHRPSNGGDETTLMARVQHKITDLVSAIKQMRPVIDEAPFDGGHIIHEPASVAKPLAETSRPTVAKPVQEASTVVPSSSAPAQNKRIAVGMQATIEETDKPLPQPKTENWVFPPLDLLQTPKISTTKMDEAELQAQAERLQEVLADFGIKGDIVKIHPGPVVTLYELEPSPGTKSSRVISLSEDIARSMEAISVRAAVIPGKNAIGIEIPNETRETVYLRSLLQTKYYAETKCKIPLVLGKDIGGHPIIADLGKMPHLLVAGTTGSGKSVAVNTMLLSMIYALPPEKCRFIMIDPKMLELSVYDGIPHLLSPVVTEPGKAVVALKWAVREMEERYRSMSKLGVRNIDGYNMRIKQAIEDSEVLTKKVQTGFDADTGKPVFEEQAIDLVELPYIVIVVDEFADLMMVAGKDVEAAVQRLAQMARAAGIHLIMATQRPSVDVITGTVKANFPTRISFQVTSKIDSRTILGEGGAESLLGMGDMLYMASGGRITRVHGPFASDDEVEKIVKHCKRHGQPSYIEDVTDESGGGDILGLFGEGDDKNSEYDELYDEAVAIVARDQKASTSYIQRQLQIGYNRAARIIEQMEKDGVIGPANHVGKREIKIGER